MSRSRTHSVASSSSLEIIDDEELRNEIDERNREILDAALNRESFILTNSTSQLEEDIVEGLENATKGITVSQFSPEQVVFEGVKDTYSDVIEVRVESKGDELKNSDAVGIFRTPFLEIKDCLGAAVVNIDIDNKLRGLVKLTCLDQLTDTEFYQFQYLRQASQGTPEKGETTHKISGASVPWQFIPVLQQGKVHEKATREQGPAVPWEKEKFNNILYQMWSEHTSRLTEFCIAEQVKEFISPLEPGIQKSFLLCLINPGFSDPRLYKCCSVYSKMGRVFTLLANMQIRQENSEQHTKTNTFGDLVKQVIAKYWTFKSMWDNDMKCTQTGQSPCKCILKDLILKSITYPVPDGLSLSTVMVSSNNSKLSQREKSVLEGWNSASTLQSSLGSQQGSNNALQSSSSNNSSCDSMKSQEANSWQETAVALKKENVHLKSQLASVDSSILILQEEKKSAQTSLSVMVESKEKFEQDIQLMLQRETTKASENHLEKERLQGELNRMKKVVDDSIKDKANLCAKLEMELNHREKLIKRIEELEANQQKFDQERAELVKSKEKLKNELVHMNQMLEAAQMSKEAAAKVSEEQAATEKAATQQSGSLSWVNCAEDSIPDGVDKDLVKAFSSMGSQLEQARAKIKHLEDELKIKEAELKHLAQIQSTADVNAATETADKEKSADASKIKADIEAQFAAKIKVLEAESKAAVWALEARTQKLEAVQAELRGYMDTNIDQMSQRLSSISQESKDCEIKLQKLESGSGSETWSDCVSVSSRGSLASSCASNMNSIKIASELSQTAARGQQQQLTRGGDESDQILRLKKYFLPDPLVPEKVDNDPGIPELRKREPSRYSMSSTEGSTTNPTENAGATSSSQSTSDISQPDWLNKEDGTCLFCQDFVSKIEEHVCGKETEMSKAHKIQKDLLKKEVPFCPLCFITFEKSQERELQAHVNTHFQDVNEDSFLHIGID